jgi:hypothetical protein
MVERDGVPCGSRRGRGISAVFAIVVAALGIAAAIADAADGPRTWKDASGKFEIEARLVDRTDTKVKLKKADGKVIEVPIEKLGKADRDHLAKLAEEEKKKKEQPPEDPFAVEGTAEPKWVVRTPKTPRTPFPKAEGTPAEDGATLPATGRVLALRNDVLPKGLEPDPLPPLAAVGEGGLLVAEAGSFTDVSPPLLLDPEKLVFAVALTQAASGADDGSGRIYVAPLPKGPAKMVFDNGKALRLLDHDVASGRTLLVSGVASGGRGGELVVVTGLATGKPEEVLRRRPPTTGRTVSGKPEVAWGRLLDGETMLAVVDDHFYAWNLVTGEMLFTLGEIHYDAVPALSPGRRYLAVPGEKGVSFLDPVKGQGLGFLPTDEDLSRPATVHFHPDGVRVATIDPERVVVHDLVDGEETASFTLSAQSEFAGSLQEPFGWVDDQLLLGASGHLVRTDLAATLWKYDLRYGTKAASLPGGIVVSGRDRGFGLMMLRVPSPAAIRAAAQLEKLAGDIFVTKEGTEVCVTADTADGVDRERVLRALRAIAEKAGWTVVPVAAVTLAGVMKRGKPQEIKYTKTQGLIPFPGAPAPPGAEGQTLTVTPFGHTLEVRSGGEVVWSRRGFEFAPFLVRPNDGESLQAAVERANVPRYDDFEKLVLPERILKPEYRSGFGESEPQGAQWQEKPRFEQSPTAAPKRRAGRAAGAR